MSSRSIPRALPATKHASYKEVSSQYYDDDICGDRAGWTTYTVTWRVHWVEFADSFHLSYTATGRYVTDFDDPAIEDYEGQFTASTHFNLTPGGTVTATEQFHDSPGSIQIKTHAVFTEVDGAVRVDRYSIDVTGCP
ncbi:MAG: hypothetical protein OEV61_12070 [Chloroflexota bacterium]|nr:hypothetical protein [Chloroflexota bacterium]MDH5242368.1 hypothetical protein [Chloroflexota bacterium]